MYAFLYTQVLTVPDSSVEFCKTFIPSTDSSVSLHTPQNVPVHYITYNLGNFHRGE